MFGKGVYFADMVSKSANYCMTSPSNNTGLMLLCEVALGDMWVHYDDACWNVNSSFVAWWEKSLKCYVGNCYTARISNSLVLPFAHVILPVSANNDVTPLHVWKVLAVLQPLYLRSLEKVSWYAILNVLCINLYLFMSCLFCLCVNFFSFICK